MKRLIGLVVLLAACSMPQSRKAEQGQQEAALSNQCTLPLPVSAPPSPPYLGQSQVSQLTEYIPADHPQQYREMAEVDGALECSDDYSLVEYCFNRDNPPTPSILRRMHTGLGDVQDNVVPWADNSTDLRDPRLISTWAPIPVAAKPTQILPLYRTNADGRIVMMGWGRGRIRFSVFRPENVSYDMTTRTRGANNVMEEPNSGWTASLHPLTWFNPHKTGFKVAGPEQAQDEPAEVFSLSNMPDVIHSTFCEASSPKAVKSPKDRPDNPYPCRARYGTLTFLDALPTATGVWSHQPLTDQPVDGGPPPPPHNGLCYDLSVVIGADATETQTHLPNTHLELRSSPLTIFIADALTATSGQWGNLPNMQDVGSVWVYPRGVGHWVCDDLGGPDNCADRHYELPDFADYDMDRLFPVDSAEDPNTHEFRLLKMLSDRSTTVTLLTHTGPQQRLTRTGCFNTSPGVQRASWCAFLDQQSYQKDFAFDMNRDAVPNYAPDPSMTYWNGRGGEGFSLLEPTIAADGRLMIINVGKFLSYSINEAPEPCAADGWKSFLPITLMPVDPAARNHYGLAHTAITADHPEGEPFRDPSGNELPPGSYFWWTYPWIDREGNNLTFAAYNTIRDGLVRDPTGMSFIDTATGAPVGHGFTPAPEVYLTTSWSYLRDHFQGFGGSNYVILGSWTGHKMVLPDNSMNRSSTGGQALRGTIVKQGASHSVTYAEASTMSAYRETDVQLYQKTVQTVNSPENRYYQFDALKPSLPFDVVWNAGTDNQFNSELVFDEYLMPSAWVVAPMNETLHYLAVAPRQDSDHEGRGWLTIDNGFVPAHSPVQSSVPGFHFVTPDDLEQSEFKVEGAQIRLQNTASRSTVPYLVLHGGARIEPLALGGVLGKGVYLDGKNDFMSFTYPFEPKHDWYFGLWLDARSHIIDPAERSRGQSIRMLYEFPHGSWVGLLMAETGATLIAVNGADQHYRSLPLGQLVRDGLYVHLGLKMVGPEDGRMLRVLINGTDVGTLDVSGYGIDPMGKVDEGPLTTWVGAHGDRELSVAFEIGSQTPSTQERRAFNEVEWRTMPVKTFAGWVDEFRVYRLDGADATSEDTWFREYSCNLALGTLVDMKALPTSGSAAITNLWALQAAFKGATGHGNESGLLCEQLVLETNAAPADLPQQHGRTHCTDRFHKNGMPPECARGRFMHPPDLHATQPRPDMTANAFCLSCHTSQSPVSGLTLAALNPGTMPRWQDARRQPMNPPATLALPELECPVPGSAGTSTLIGTWYEFVYARGEKVPGQRNVWKTDVMTDPQSPAIPNWPGLMTPY